MTGLWRIALREMRAQSIRGGRTGGRTRGFRIFLLCLLLGVAIVAGVGSLAASIDAGIAADGKRILGGDFEFRLTYQPVTQDQANALSAGNQMSHTVEMRAMARNETANAHDPNPTLVELKSVDLVYPLFGKVALDPDQSLHAALQPDDQGRYGAVGEPALVQRLGLKPGDTIKLGDASFVFRGTILNEPDRGSQVFNLGPRLMISSAALAATDLVQPGSLVYHVYRVKLGPGIAPSRWISHIRQEFPDPEWRVRGVEDAGAGVRDFIDRTRMFLNLVGLSALLIGGLGIGNAVRVYLESRAQSLAILKSLGASGGFILALHLVLILRMAAIGIVLGLVAGAAIPYLAQDAFAQFNLHLIPALYAAPLLIAAAFGLLTAFAFSLPPLLQAMRVRPAQLFRSVAAELGEARRRDLIPVGIAGLLLILLAVLATGDLKLALGFVLAVLASFGLFKLLALGLRALARWGRARADNRALRFALAAIDRPRAPTASIVLSLGLGLTVLVAVMLIQTGLIDEMQNALPARAPSFYLLDIQSNQVADLQRDLNAFPSAEDFQEVPMLRGRIVKMKGISVDRIPTPPDHAWVLKGDRGVTWSKNPAPGSHLVEGQWWAPDYHGPTLVSLDADTAKAFGLKIGDTITINLLGREITGTIHNLRQIDWSSLSINFVMVFSPGVVSSAPQTHIATIRVAPEQEGALIGLLAKDFPNVSAVRVRDVIAQAGDVLRSVGAAVRLAAGVALLAGVLVLAGAMAAGQERRIYEAVLIKMLGGRRRDIALSFLWEFALLALSAAAIALVIGSIGAYVFLDRVMETKFVFSSTAAFGAVALSLALALIVGFAASWRALGAKAAPYLRNE
ncbi:MAG TPA: FtsX-like permease family protein [Dongiaceae bacterium]|nr:FtsX-like permease family protein [Dongiaceae bacterium]